MPDSTITLRTRADLSALIGARNSFAVLTSEEQKAERQALALAQSMARLDAKLGDTAGGAQRLRAALQNAAFIDNRQGVAALNQIISLEQKAAAEAARLGKAGGLQILPRTVESFGTDAINQFKAGLLGVVGPAAAATTAITALTATAASFKDAFTFKAALDATTASVKSQLEGFRNASQVYAEANAFGRQYNITQEETNNILRSSVGSLRTSSASVIELESALIRLQSKDVSKPISEAARALAELESGDVTSIKELFRVSAKDALGMRDAIVAGGDSVQVLTAYLDRTQTGMQALELRAQGVQGALNAAEVAAEDLKLAQADLAQGPGVIATQTYTGVLQLLTSALTQGAKAQKFFNDVQAESAGGGGGGTFEFNRGVEFASAYVTSASAAAQAAVDAAAKIQFMGQAMQLTAEASVLATAKQDAQKAITAGLAAETNASVNAFLALNPNLNAAGVASLVAAGKVPKLIGELAAMRLEAERLTGQLNLLAAQQAGVAGLSKLFAVGIDPGKGVGGGAGSRLSGGARGTLTEFENLLDSRAALELSNAKTTADKIAFYQRQLARQTSEEGRNRIQAIINGLRNSGGGGKPGGVGLGALDRIDIDLAGDYQAQLDAVNRKLAAGNLTELQRKQLQKDRLDLEKKIADEQERANRASIDARIAAIEDRKERREEAKRLSAANAVLAHPELFNEEQKANAADLVELIPLQQQKRAEEINAKAREAGLAPGAAIQPITPTPAPGAATQPAGQAPPAPAPITTGAGTPLILQLDGKNVGSILLPYLVQGLNSMTQQVRAAGG